MHNDESMPTELDNELVVLAKNAGIPELVTFEHDSGELVAAQEELREKIELLEGVNELLEDPFFQDRE